VYPSAVTFAVTQKVISRRDGIQYYLNNSKNTLGIRINGTIYINEKRIPSIKHKDKKTGLAAATFSQNEHFLPMILQEMKP